MNLSDRQLLILAGITIVLACWAINGVLFSPLQAFDDAYITLNNAMLLSGRETVSVFAQKSALAGSTSIVHTCLIAMLLTTGLDPETALLLAGLLGAVLYILGAAFLIDLAGLSRWRKIQLLPIGFLMAVIPYQLMNGLETGLAMAIVIWSIYAFEQGSWGKTHLLPLLIGIMPFIRPELSALAALLLLSLTYEKMQWIKDKPTTSGLQKIFCLSTPLLLAMLAALPFMLASHADSGHFFPNTIHAKKYFFAEGCLSPLQKSVILLKGLLLGFCAPLFLAVGFLPRLCDTGLGKLLLLFMAIFLAAFWINLPGGLLANEGRYFYLLMPMVLYAGILYSKQFDKQPDKNGKHSWLLLAILLQILLINLPLNLFMSHQAQAFISKNHKQLAQWIMQNTTEGNVILTHDIGYLGYALKHRHVIDMVGLATEDIANIHEQITWSSCGKHRDLAVANIVERYKPEYIAVLRWWATDFQLLQGLHDRVTLVPANTTNTGTNDFSVYSLHYANP